MSLPIFPFLSVFFPFSSTFFRSLPFPFFCLFFAVFFGFRFFRFFFCFFFFCFTPFHCQEKTGRHCSLDPFCETPILALVNIQMALGQTAGCPGVNRSKKFMCSPRNPGNINFSLWSTTGLSQGCPDFQKVYVFKVHVPFSCPRVYAQPDDMQSFRQLRWNHNCPEGQRHTNNFKFQVPKKHDVSQALGFF